MRNSRLRPAILCLGCAVACLAGCHKPKPPPSIDGLREALQRTANQTLAAPSLANEQVLLAEQPGKVDAQAQDVLQAASAAGGVAIRSVNEKGQVSILATIPDNNADAFKAALRREKIPMNKPSPSTSLIEVVIEKNTPSPTP